MTEFSQVWHDLVLFLTEKGTDNPANKVANIKRAILNAIPPKYPEDSTIIGVTTFDEMLGVQQFVNKFGFHLEYVPNRKPKNPEEKLFMVVPNWK